MAKFNLDGKEALNQIRLLIAEVENLKKSLKNINSANEESFAKLEFGLNSTREKVGLLSNKMNHLEAILKKNASTVNQNTKAQEKHNKEVKESVKVTNSNTKAQQMSNSAFKSKIPTLRQLTAFLKANNNETKKSTTGILGLGKGVSDLLKGFGLLAGVTTIVQITQNVYENIKTFDSLNFAMEKITKTTWAYNESKKFMIELTKDFGVELIPTTERWIKFLAAAEQSGLGLKETEDIFRSMTKAASVLGLQTDELVQVYLALEQMLSKGKITTEELRRQLGERLPGAMGIMAASMGKTIPELDKMMKLGQVHSAEVLPDFARAVENAYGINTVDKVETLTASQNRLATAWQNFIKTITEGDSTIKRALSSIIEGLADFVNKASYVLGDENQRNLVDVIEFEKKWKDFFRRMSETAVASHDDIDSYFSLLQQKVQKTTEELNKATAAGDTDRAKELENRLNEESIALNQLESKIVDQMKKFAAEKIDIYKANMDELLSIRKEIDNELAKPEPGFFDVVSGDESNSKFRSQANINASLSKAESANLDELKAKTLDAVAAYNVLLKLLTESKVEILPDETTEKKQRELRTIRDLALEIQNEIAQGVQDSLQVQLKDPKKSIEEKIDLIQKASDQEILIAKNTFKIRVRDAEDALIKEDESLQQSINNGRLSRERYNDFITKAEKEKNQKIEIAAIELQNKLNSIQSKSSSQLNSVGLDANDIEINKVEDKYNKEIILINSVYKASAKTSKDRKQLEKSLRDVYVSMANEIIDAKIKILQASIAGQNQDQEWVQQTIRDINTLNAARKTIAPEQEDTDKWFEYWSFITDYAREALSAIGDITDGIFESRIENINAEIEAERDKYDALITLARDDDEERQTLERNRDARIKELEKKRLKEQQKQARSRKAFAVADIGIKTAQAIMGIWADFPKFDFGISAGLATALVSALGAAQIAAVLAQPIPKYKDGTKVQKEHRGMINDGMWQEYIERGDKIMTTNRKNAIVDLQPGDIVYKNYKEMTKKSSIMNAMTSGSYISKNDFDKYFANIEGAINRGFKNAKINNTNKISVKNSNEHYKAEMSYWN